MKTERWPDTLLIKVMVARSTLESFKTLIKVIPIFERALVRLCVGPVKAFAASADHWNRRYFTARSSTQKSCNRLAVLRASFLNRFVEEHNVKSVVDYGGGGNGTQLGAVKYPSYVGVDVSEKALLLCRTVFVADSLKEAVVPILSAELALSVDVPYDLVEESVFESYMWQLFSSATRFVIIYSTNMDKSWVAEQVRRRRFAHWVEQNKPEWYVHSFTDSADPDNLSFADFNVFALR